MCCECAVHLALGLNTSQADDELCRSYREGRMSSMSGKPEIFLVLDSKCFAHEITV